MSELRVMGPREYETKNPLDLPATAESLGLHHAPTPHRVSAVAMLDALEFSGLHILDQTHVVDGVRTMRPEGNYGEIVIHQAHLFSLYKVAHPTIELPDGDLLVGYRNSIAQTMARRACVGVSFPICTNVSLFGDDLVFSKKNTTRQTNIFQIALDGVRNKVLPQFETIEGQLDKLRSRTLWPDRRRSETLRLFEDKVLPAKLVTDMRDMWADLEASPEVFEDRHNALGLMQACTRLIRDLPTRRQAEASQKISRWFGFGTKVAA